MAKKESSGFHTPFEKLRRLVEKKAAAMAAAAKPQPDPAKSPRPAVKATPPPSLPPSPARTAALARAATDDDRSFEQAMRGVTPLAAAERRRRAAPVGVAPPAAPRRRAPPRDDDVDAYAELADLVSGGGGRLAVDEDHPHSGRADGQSGGINRRFGRRLREGDYPIDARLDLHGHTREEAAAALERFITQSLAAGRRCLLVIHGRGLNSGDAGPVLRDTVQHTLSAGPVARAILAFALAPAKHGGDGATLVLLRKKRS